MAENVKVWEEDILLPTYGIGKAEKNPMFLEKRVYQGSSGVVYPYAVVEKIEDEILQLEDEILSEINEDISLKISHIRSMCRICVKNIRPLTYIMDTLTKEGMEFFSDEN